MSGADDTGIAVALRDGSRVVVRPVRPDDRELLLAGFERLGPESRYQRFLAPMAELTEDDITYLTDVDHHDHEALAAIDAGDGRRRRRRALRALRGPPGHGRGGRHGDRRLAGPRRRHGAARPARRAGAREGSSLHALLLAENRDMLEVLEALGPVHVVDRQSGTIEIEAELPPGRRRRRDLARAARSGRRGASASSSSRNRVGERLRVGHEPGVGEEADRDLPGVAEDAHAHADAAGARRPHEDAAPAACRPARAGCRGPGTLVRTIEPLAEKKSIRRSSSWAGVRPIRPRMP